MSDQYSLNHINSLIFQLALQTRELSQKKKQINQQIKVCKASIAEKRSYIETIHKTIKNLEEEIGVNQSNVLRNKEEAKSLKMTNSLMLQFEHTLKSELESRKVSYNNDTEVYDERIASCVKTLQLHQEHYFQNPLAQKLLMLQAEKEKTECRIKAWNDQITLKQKELDHLTGPAVSSVCTENLPDSVFGQQAIQEQEKTSDDQTEDSDTFIETSSHVSHTKNGHQTAVETIADDIHKENTVHGSPTCSPGTASKNLWSCQPLDEQSQMDTEEVEEHQEAVQEEQQFSVAGVKEDLEDEMQQRVAVDEKQAPNEKDNSGVTIFSQTSSQETYPQSLPEKVTSVPSTPTFPIKFNPGISPKQSTSDTKSPAFLFSVSSGPSTPGFSGFDVGSLHEEDSAFGLPCTFFNEKKTAEPKSSGCLEFLFGQPEQSGAFQFAFTPKSPESADKENTGDDFPFSFNF